jgi:16S rRNA (uracil1498-N3)-methyltransferase
VSLAPHLVVGRSLTDLVSGTLVPLPDAVVRHLRRALRLADGTALSLTDGDGAHASAELVGDAARLMTDTVVIERDRPTIVLAQSLAKGRRAEDAVRTACELGVDRIVPVVAERTQGRPDAGAAAAVTGRWRAIATAALEQSRGVHLPEVMTCASPADLAAASTPSAGTTRLVAVPGAPALPDVLGTLPAGSMADEVWVAVGPEGGWSTGEVDVLVAAGWLPVGLGATVLRTEHAGPIAVAAVAALSGRWAARPNGPGATDG